MSSKKNILIFIDWFTPAYKAGGPIKSVENIIKTFGTEANFYVITSNSDFGTNEELIGIETNKWIKKSNHNICYLTADCQTNNYIERMTKDLNPDVIYFNSLFSKNFTLNPLKHFKKKWPNSKIVLAPRGMLGAGALQIKPLKKKAFLFAAKITCLFKNIFWHASTEQEANEIKAHFGNNSKIFVAENLGTQIEVSSHSRNKKSTDGKLELLFVSRISTKKNLLFGLEAMNLAKHKSNLRLTVVGPSEDIEYTNSCKTFASKNQLNVVFTGSKTPSELAQYYLDADLFLLPTQHENYGHVIAEALSYGLPLLISKNTPWQNLEKLNIGFDLTLDTSLFASKIDTFFEMNDEQWLEKSEKAKAFANTSINSGKSIADNRKIFLE